MSEPMKPITAGLGSLFANLERRARETLDLADRVRTVLPEPEKYHVLSASYREDTLIVTTDSAAWASRLRYLHDELLGALSEGRETPVTKLHVRVGQIAE